MAFNPAFHNTLDPKPKFYTELAAQCIELLQGQRNVVTNTANVSAMVYHGLLETPARAAKPVNWAGFYLRSATKPDTLVLGPFQGKPACTEIAFGRGVCGTAASTAQSVVVEDVHKFPSHIACDSASKSEIVVPLKSPDGKVLGVLDVDSPVAGAFDEYDRIGLEAIANMVVEASDF
ncbi:hypothetical protein GGF46_000917 [Coemansia sp. RSA 552]|nr:hypothetical protein GGF46_000917 [Coemansia sp. RSA 552]